MQGTASLFCRHSRRAGQDAFGRLSCGHDTQMPTLLQAMLAAETDEVVCGQSCHMGECLLARILGVTLAMPHRHIHKP